MAGVEKPMDETDSQRKQGTRVFKKSSPNGKVTVYLGKRDFIDHLTHIDPIDGVVLVDPDYLKERKVYAHVLAAFRYGREDLDVLGLTFRKDLFLASMQVFPAVKEQQKPLTRLQERLIKKLGPNAYPFFFELPPNAPASVTLQPAPGDTGKPCGVDYELKTYVAENLDEKPHKRNSVRLAIRKLTYAPEEPAPQPSAETSKDFMMSPGNIKLEASLDKELCVPLQWRCDGHDDCGDQSDESKIVCDMITCASDTHLRCDNGKCIPVYLACDGINHCGDNSDENTNTTCVEEEPLVKECSVVEFQCGNGNCVPSDVRCDHGNDCGDASDEVACAKPNMTIGCSVNNGGCEHNCTQTLDGHYCTCHRGFQSSDSDKTSCEDINECEHPDHGCPQLCNNVKGSYKCQCAQGFRDTKGQGQDCKPEDVPRTMFFSTLTEIRRYRPDKKEYSGAVIQGQNVGFMDIDIEKELLYWTDTRASAIYRAPIPDKPDRRGIPQDIGVKTTRPYAVAVDWVQDVIYWSDIKLGEICVSLFDGRYQRTLLSDIVMPLAIAVNPKLGLMYWTDADTAFPKIERAWMNGAERSVIVSSHLLRPSALTIDYIMYDRVYFADYKLGMIESMKPDGTDRRIIIRTVSTPVSLDLFESKVYWVSQRNDSAHYMNKFGRANSTVLQTNLVFPGSVRLYHRLKVDLEIKTRCPRAGDTCSHLCLLVPDGFRCACPDGSQFRYDSTFICDAGLETAKPAPQMCACYNDGDCIKGENDTYTCVCPPGYTGSLCEVVEPRKLSVDHQNNHLLAILIPSSAVFLLTLVVLVIFVIKYRRKKSEKVDPTKVAYTGRGNVEILTAYQLQHNTLTTTPEDSSCTNFCNPVYETCQGEDPGVYMHIEHDLTNVAANNPPDQADMKDVTEISVDNAQYCVNPEAIKGNQGRLATGNEYTTFEHGTTKLDESQLDITKEREHDTAHLVN